MCSIISLLGNAKNGKSTMHVTPTRMGIIKKTELSKEKSKFCWGCAEISILTHCCRECKRVQLLWKSAWQISNKLNIELQYGPGVSLRDIDPKDLTKGLIGMFMEAHYSQQPKGGNCPTAHQLMSEHTKCGLCTPWNTSSVRKGMK
jgi:hypothetical protein